MKKNKCDNCLVAFYQAPPYELSLIFRDDLKHSCITDIFNYCPYCRS